VVKRDRRPWSQRGRGQREGKLEDRVSEVRTSEDRELQRPEPQKKILNIEHPMINNE
jgi:hypothetical protein